MADTVHITLSCSEFSWTVTTPASAGGFQFFHLPQAASTRRPFFPAGTCQVSLWAGYHSRRSYQDLFSHEGRFRIDPQEETRYSYLINYLRLQ